MSFNFIASLSGEKMQMHLYRGTLWFVQFLACLAVAWTIAYGWWWVCAVDSASLVNDVQTLQQQNNRVVSRHFFGVMNVSQSQPNNATEASTQPSGIDPRWRLLGTYIQSGRRSQALMMFEGSAETLIVQMGEKIPSGQTVSEVLPDSIVLGSGSQRTELPLRPPSMTAREPEGSPLGRPAIPGMPQPTGSASFNKDSR